MRKGIILVLVFMFLSGCITGPSNGGNIPTYDPYQGTEGVVATFLENSPPLRITPGSSVNIGLEVYNKGAFDTADIKVVLDYNTEDFSIGGGTQSLQLNGRSKYSKIGESDAVFWNAQVKDVSMSRDAEIDAILQYKYQTNAFVDYCVDPDRYNKERLEKACSYQESISLSGQGAPVGVVKIESVYVPQSDTSGEIEFTFHVQNLQQGDIYGGGGTSSQGEMNNLQLSATLGNSQLSCSSSTVDLAEGEGEAICTGSYNADAAYKSTLHVQLDYVYRQTIEGPVVRIYIPSS